MLLLLAAALAPIQTFTIHEQFGVTHPPQIIDFDFGKRIDPDRTYMIGPQGMQVPFQLLHDGKIAVEAALAANSRAEWKLYAAEARSHAPKASQRRCASPSLRPGTKS